MFCKYIGKCPFGLEMTVKGIVDSNSKPFANCLEAQLRKPGHKQVWAFDRPSPYRVVYAWDKYGRKSPLGAVCLYNAVEVADRYLENLPKLKVVTFVNASERTCVVCKGLQVDREDFQNIWFGELRTEYGRKKIIKAYRKVLPKEFLEDMLRLARAGRLYEPAE